MVVGRSAAGWDRFFSTADFDGINRPAEKTIKKIGERIDRLPPNDPTRAMLKRKENIDHSS
jgi:hypothetical protein